MTAQVIVRVHEPVKVVLEAPVAGFEAAAARAVANIAGHVKPEQAREVQRLLGQVHDRIRGGFDRGYIYHAGTKPLSEWKTVEG